MVTMPGAQSRPGSGDDETAGARSSVRISRVISTGSSTGAFAGAAAVMADDAIERRYSRRQVKSRFALMPASRASAETDAPILRRSSLNSGLCARRVRRGLMPVITGSLMFMEAFVHITPVCISARSWASDWPGGRGP
jgi:hypothetical protein